AVWPYRRIVLVASLLAGPAAGQHSGPNVKSYDFWVSLPDTGSQILGHATITLHRLYPGDSILTLNLSAMTVDSVTGTRGGRRPYSYDGARLSIRLGPSDSVTGVFYHGVPVDGLIIGSNAHGRRVVFGDNWPQHARYWLPTIDDPSDKALVLFFVGAPSSWRVVGIAIETHADGWPRSVPVWWVTHAIL